MSKCCYIVGAGEDYGIDFVPGQDDLVIAADGGCRALRQVGIMPHLVIGDFDSLSHAPEGVQVITLPTEKDVTDTWAAIDWAKERGYTDFCLYGCTGGRIEHTIANIQTAAALAQQKMRCRIVDRDRIITAICNETVTFSKDHTGYVSVFAFTDECRDVTLQGLKYELKNARLSSCFPLGVSNEFIGKEAKVSVGSGIAVLIYGR